VTSSDVDGRRAVWTLAVLASLSFVSFSIVTPVLDVLIRARFSDSSATSRFMAVHGIAALVFAMVGGVVSDRLGRRVRLLALSLMGSGVATALLPIVDDFGLLLVIRFADGACGAMALVLIFARTLDLGSPSLGRSRAVAVVSTSVAIGFLIAPVLTWSLGHRLPVLFGIVGMALIVAGMWTWAREAEFPIRHRPMKPLRRVLRHLARRPGTALPIAFTFVDRFTFGTLAHLTSLVLMDLWGKSVTWSSACMFLFWICFLAACLPGGRACERRGAMTAMTVGSALYGGCLLLLGVGHLGVFMVAMAFAGAFCALQYIPSVVLLSDLGAGELHATGMGLWSTAGSVGLVLGMGMSGWLSQHGYALAFAVAGGLEIASAGVGLVVLAREGRRVGGGAPLTY